MSDLIRRQDAIDAIHKEFDEVCVWDESGQTTANEVENILYDLPSAEPERTAKVVEGQKGSWYCTGCGKWCDKGEDIYCSHCGARLEWSE